MRASKAVDRSVRLSVPVRCPSRRFRRPYRELPEMTLGRTSAVQTHMQSTRIPQTEMRQISAAKPTCARHDLVVQTALARSRSHRPPPRVRTLIPHTILITIISSSSKVHHFRLLSSRREQPSVLRNSARQASAPPPDPAHSLTPRGKRSRRSRDHQTVRPRRPRNHQALQLPSLLPYPRWIRLLTRTFRGNSHLLNRS